MIYDKELVEEFVVESREHLADIEDDLLQMERAGGGIAVQTVDKVFRAIHSIKGAAGFLGLRKINDLSHVMETILQTIRAGEARPDSKTVDALLGGVDLLGAMLADIDNCDKVDIQKIHDRLSSLLAKQVSSEVRKDMRTSIRMLDEEGRPAGFSVSALALKNRPKTHDHLYILRYELQEMQRKGGLSPLTLVKELLSTGEIVQAKLNSDAKSLSEDLSRASLDYEVLYSTVLDADLIESGAHLPMDKIVKVHPEGESQVERSQAKEAPKAKAAEQKAAEAAIEKAPAETEEPKAAQDAKGQDRQETVRMNIAILDKLMTLAGELVLVRNQHLMRFSELNDVQARGISQRLDIVTSELQETIMRTRMQPVGVVFGKLPRLVRDLAQKLGKQIELSLSGEEVELDKAILESLADPLVHIIRNSCDHGLEKPEDRERSGKRAAGKISVRAYHEGGQINIEVADDGQGVNIDRVKAKALESGIVTAEQLARMGEKDLVNLIARPGFSTAEKLTEISGRGVGMDVVKSAIERLGGSLEISTIRGEGTSILMRLPLTLAIIPCLIVVVGGQSYALPQANLEELVCLYDKEMRDRIECEDVQEVFRLRDKLLPMVRLNEILARPKPFCDEDKAKISESHRRKCASLAEAGALKGALTFAVVKVGSNRFGLIVDKVVGTEEIVVKPMHSTLKPLGVYSGATVMGDGRCALILDIDGVAAHAGLDFAAKSSSQGGVSTSETEAAKREETQTVLLFHNGPDEQFAVPLQLVKRIERIERKRLERIGEKEFISVDGKPTRIVRLDKALKVSACEDRDEMYLILPKHSSRPFGLLISSLVDILESPMDLSSDGYLEDGVLGTAVLRGRITVYPDIYRLVEKVDPEWLDERKESGAAPEEKRRILLVEDAVFFRQLVKAYLESDGYEVETASNGRKALDRLEAGGAAFDLVVSDIEMPVMNGWELVKALKADKKLSGIPVIALTALDDKKEVGKAKEYGFDQYQIKIDREALLRTVSESLLRAKNARSHQSKR